MPRKQRFKPSRKPKPMDAPQGEQQHPPSQTGQIEHGNPPRDEDRGVMEHVGGAA